MIRKGFLHESLSCDFEVEVEVKWKEKLKKRGVEKLLHGAS